MDVIVYKYGLMPPTGNADLIDDLLVKFNKVKNGMVEATRRHRDVRREVDTAKDEIVGEITEKVKKLKAESDEIENRIKKIRQTSKKRSDTAGERANLAEAKKRSKEARSEQVEAKKAVVDAGLIAKLDESFQLLKKEKSEIKKKIGLFWGSSELAQAAVEQSDETLKGLWRWSRKKGEMVNLDPRFSMETSREGMLGVRVQLKDPLSADGLMECKDNRLQLRVHPLPSGALSKSQKRRRRATLNMRLFGEGPGYKTPVWGEWPVLMHRPLPDGACIKGAKVIRYKISDRDKWEVHLTIAVEKKDRLFGINSVAEKHGDGAVFVNFGWREKENGRRVAYIRDDDGSEKEILVDPSVISGLRKTDSLKSIRKKLLDKMRASLWDWRKDQKKDQKTLPSWFADKTSNLYEWESVGKFAALRRNWEKNRWDGDEEGFTLLFEWEIGKWCPDIVLKSGKRGRRDGSDLHLWRWEDNQRKKSIRRRKDQYRQVAAGMARRYAVLVVEDWDMSKTKKNKPTESEKVDIDGAKKALQETAPGELREMMVQAFWARGGRVVKVDPVLDTQRCHVCGCEIRWDAIPKIDHTCQDCGVTWDQDSNNVRNVELKFGAMKEAGEAIGESGRSKNLSKWASRMARKEERLKKQREKEDSVE